METVVMVIGEEMFSWRQEGGEGGEGTVEMGRAPNSRMEKERDWERLCELKAESGYYPTGPKSAFGFKIQILTQTKPNTG